jgi:hypothetical protein
MLNEFLCPSCHNLLNVGKNVIFSTRSKANKAGIIILHPDRDEYSVMKHPSFIIENGDRIDFTCPYCNKKLNSDRNENLAKVIMRDENKVEYEIHFSRVASEHTSYRIVGMSVEILGEDANEYINFRNLIQAF